MGLCMEIKKIKKYAGTAFVEKRNLTGKFGDYVGYVVYGDTYPIKDSLNNLGFKWKSYLNGWLISEKKMNEYVSKSLAQLGVITTQPTLKITPTMQPAPQAQQTTQATPAQQIAPTAPIPPPQQIWKTENEEMTRWYGFPMNKNVKEFDLEFELLGDKHTEHVTIERTYVKGKGYSEKSREFKGIPKYIVYVGSKAVEDKTEPLATLSYISKQKWGTYNEEEYLKSLEKTIRTRIENNPPQQRVSTSHIDLTHYYDCQKRTPEFKQFLEDLSDKKVQPEYHLTIDEGEYKGTYPVTVHTYRGADTDTIYVDSNLQNSLNKSQKTIGYGFKLTGIHTREEFDKAMNEYLKTDEPKKYYLDFLKSFPFLASQQEESKKHFTTIQSLLETPNSSADEILRKIQEYGYIRPSKRQRQQESLSLGDEIHWVIDSKKIVNDVYSNSFLHSTPEFFYAVIAYYVHRKVRGIWSWTDMMLTDSIYSWIRAMEAFGAKIDRKEIYSTIEKIGNIIVEKIYGKATQEQKDKKSFNDFYGYTSGEESGARPTRQTDSALSEFIEFAKQFGIEAEGIENNLKQVYRVLANQTHPDKFQDEEKQKEMTKKFQDLQDIWSRIPQQFKTALNWYDRVIYS